MVRGGARVSAKLRVLLLSAGSLVAHAFLEALGTRRDGCTVIGTNSIAEAAGNFLCDTAYLVPRAASAAYVERLAEIVRAEDPHIVIPTRDDDVLAVAQLRERMPHTHAALLAGSMTAAQFMNDKLETARFAARHGLPFAPTVATLQEALDMVASHGGPLIGKPRRGHASRGVVVLSSAAEIRRAFDLRGDLIVQPFLDPPPELAAATAPFEAGFPLFFSLPGTTKYSTQTVIGPDGGVSGTYGTLATAAGGKIVDTRRCEDPELIAVGDAYARSAAAEGWRGPLNVQLRRSAAGKLTAFELNGRLAGGVAVRVFMGFDEIAEIVDRFLPGFDFPRLDAGGCDVVQQQLATYGLPREALATLTQTGRWSRS